MRKGLTVEPGKVIKELREELSTLGNRIAVIREELSHWEKAVQLHDQRRRHSRTGDKEVMDFSRFADLSELAIVLKVAEEHNGDIEMKLVTKIFKGKVKNPKNAGPAAYTNVQRLVKQGRAIKVGRGLYRLTGGEKPKATELSKEDTET